MDFSNVTQAKYIKLGAKAEWDDLCFSDGTVRLGYYEVPGDYKVANGKKPVFEIFRRQRKDDKTASSDARQVYDFYAVGPETIWVTFSKGQLWWCQTHQAVEFIGNDKASYPQGSRLKRTISGWRNCSISGRPININDMSGRLTKVAGFRGTICNIQDLDYLLRLLQDQRNPEVEKVEQHKAALCQSIESLLTQLTPKDFELLVDLIFSRSGWQRVSIVGGQMKTIDLELVLPLTNERAVVQVKSKTNQKELDEYISRLQVMPADRAFYVYHTSQKDLKCDEEGAGVRLMGPNVIAEQVIRAGLIDWLMGKVG